MSDFKIPGGPKESPDINTISEASDAIDRPAGSDDVSAISAGEVGTVEQIAADVASGAISRDEAVDRLLANVMDSEMIRDVPEAMREGLRDALEALLESDPHLGSLVAAIGPREIE